MGWSKRRKECTPGFVLALLVDFGERVDEEME